MVSFGYVEPIIGVFIRISLEVSVVLILLRTCYQTSPGRPSNAHANEAIFNVGQGTFQAQGLLVNGVTSSGDIVKASGGASKVSLVDAVFTNNVVGNVSAFWVPEKWFLPY